jgi:hypothetical protein
MASILVSIEAVVNAYGQEELLRFEANEAGR